MGHLVYDREKRFFFPLSPFQCCGCVAENFKMCADLQHWFRERGRVKVVLPNWQSIIKIMPCVEGDRSDCQPEANSTARRQKLRAEVVLRVDNLIYHPQRREWSLFLVNWKSIAHSHCVYLCLYTLGPFKTQRWARARACGFCSNIQ